MRIYAKAGDQGQPGSGFEPVADELFYHASGHGCPRGAVVLATRPAVCKNVIKVVTLVLGETIDANFKVVFANRGVQRRLQAGIIGGLVHSGDHRHIVRPAGVAGLVVVIER